MLWVSVGAGVTLSLTAAALVVSERLVLGSARGRWVYPYAVPFRPGALIAALVAAAAVATLLHLTGRRASSR